MESIKISLRVPKRDFPTSNNVAEYKALVNGLRLARALHISYLRVYCDSQLIVLQVQGTYIAKDEKIE
ncbi:hypothetical protein QJS04_geneDACA022005 [Acorus gramineus]|uniref:RNase H type-1 domain-containing protein n=1 Tax=Acorus gramineus TaxID=55184 RepID=A0AAV8ZZA4_ACOGR|nr:hypothetical protein QJS04_geneDACA022005 [Acorus gramineus]